MGMGEPLANLDRLLPALDEARREDGLGISARRITISTVGLPPAIDRLAKHPVHYRLAVSLHAPNDELRNQLVPVNKNIGLAAILAAADRYFEVSGRRLTFEYVLLADVNDAPEHARQLAGLLAGREALLNVIPYNPVAGLPYGTPTPERRRGVPRDPRTSRRPREVPPPQRRPHRRRLRPAPPRPTSAGAAGRDHRGPIKVNAPP